MTVRNLLSIAAAFLQTSFAALSIQASHSYSSKISVLASIRSTSIYPSPLTLVESCCFTWVDTTGSPLETTKTIATQATIEAAEQWTIRGARERDHLANEKMVVK